MKTKSLLRAALFCAAGFATATSLFGQNVTWTARNLPPGMSLSTLNGTTARISGTPTTPGTYESIVFPSVGGNAGDMRRMKFVVFPAGTVPPAYTSYDREVASGPNLTAVAGGGGVILLARASSGYSSFGFSVLELFSTTTGTTFSGVTKPGALTELKGAAASGNRTLLLGDGNAFLGPITGPFSPVTIPATQPYGTVIAANGSDGFLLVTHDWDSTGAGGYTMRFQSMPALGGNWTQRYQESKPNSDAPNECSSAANGAIRIVALSAYNSPYGLYRSANSGQTWAKVANSDIMYVTFGKGKFIGAGNTGTWQSTDGLTWTKTGTFAAGKLAFCPSRNLFFSENAGVSTDGVYWRSYWNSPYGPALVTSGTGLIFQGGDHIVPNTVPTFYTSGSFSTGANAPFSTTFSVND